MPIEEVLVKIRTDFKDMEKTSKGLTRFALVLRKLTMQMLGLMFFGMAMERFFKGLIGPSLELVGVFDLWNTVLGIMFLPTALQVNDILLSISNVLLSLHPPLQEAIGSFALLGMGLGNILSVVGQLALGIGALTLAWGTFTTIVLPFLGWVTLVSLLIIGLITIWKNWNSISTSTKILIAGLGFVLASLIIFISPVAAAIVGIAVAILILMAIIKNWGKITDWIKDKWTIAITWISEKIQALLDLMQKLIDKARNSIIGRALGKIGGVLGSRQSGGIVPFTGPYLLHAGEEVGRSFTFAPIITVNATGNSLDIANRIKMELNQMWAQELNRLAR